MIAMMPASPPRGAIGGKPCEKIATTAAAPNSAYTTSVAVTSEGGGAGTGACVSLIAKSPCHVFKRWAGALGVTTSVLVRRVLAIAIVAPHDVVIGIESVVAFDPAPDLEIAGRLVAAIDEVMRVAAPGRVARAGTGGKRLLACICHEHDLTGEHVDELV